MMFSALAKVESYRGLVRACAKKKAALLDR